MTRKSIAAWLLTLVMCLSLFSISAFADGDPFTVVAGFENNKITVKATGLSDSKKYTLLIVSKEGGASLGYGAPATSPTNGEITFEIGLNENQAKAFNPTTSQAKVSQVLGGPSNVVTVDFTSLTSYTVTFDLGAAVSNPDDAYKAQTIYSGGTATSVANPTPDNANGYAFDKWTYAATATPTTSLGDWSWETAVTQDITITANWKAKYAVTFDVNKPAAVTSKNVTGAPDTQYVVSGEKVSKPDPDPTLAGWAFQGWKNGSNNYNFDAAVTKVLTLKASWKATDLTLKNPAKSGDFADRFVNDPAPTVTIEEPETGTGSYSYSMKSVSGFTFDQTTRTITDNRSAASTKTGTLTVTIKDEESNQTKTVTVNYGKVMEPVIPYATTTSKDITLTAGTQVPTGTTIIVNVGNDTVKTGASSYIDINLPSGVSANAVRTSENRITVTLSGTPSAAQSKTPLTIKVPAGALESNTELTATGTVTLTVKKAVKEVEVITQPTKKNYTSGNQIDPAGLVIKVTYTDNSDENITYSNANKAEFSFSPSTLSTSTTSVTGTYGGKTFTIDGLTVSAAPTGGGGGGAAAAANVTTSSASNGSIKVSNTAASAGDKVTVTLTPSKGYEADTLTVKDKSGATVTATKNTDGTYTFTMPAASKLPVSVSATFKKAEEVKPVDNGTGFVDVTSGEFYTDAVAWAAKNGITKGTDDTHFSPNASCTRAQVVTFLWRAAGSPAVASSAGFSDIESGSYYSQAVAWAVANGITNGTDADHFSPEATVNRAQVVTFLYRYEKATASGSNSFTDVPANAYYSDAVTWAVTNSITNGTGSNRFSPENDCTRGQIVTFLYRDFVK